MKFKILLIPEAEEDAGEGHGRVSRDREGCHGCGDRDLRPGEPQAGWGQPGAHAAAGLRKNNSPISQAPLPARRRRD